MFRDDKVSQKLVEDFILKPIFLISLLPKEKYVTIGQSCKTANRSGNEEVPSTTAVNLQLRARSVRYVVRLGHLGVTVTLNGVIQCICFLFLF